MSDFAEIKFKGAFRPYQIQILNNIDLYQKDEKLNIVSAPGSGKTILGLELIRRLGKKTLILAPTITIRQQWKERFQEHFLADPTQVDDYFSISIKEPKLITAITYQSLYAAYNREIEENKKDSEQFLEDEICDYSDFDLIKILKDNQIETLCLDEAHHLRNNWHGAIIKVLDEYKGIKKTISLTATPPYDSTLTEWNKYINLCGTIDEEIFIPELVKAHSLCPHQDYIYFNYPSLEEENVLKEYREKANAAVQMILIDKIFHPVLETIEKINETKEDDFYDNSVNFIAIYALARSANLEFNEKVLRKLLSPNRLEPYSLKLAEKVLQFIIFSNDIFSNKVIQPIKKILNSYDLITDRSVYLTINDKIRKMLVSSINKINSINDIVQSEYNNLHDKLKMVILTDRIRKEYLQFIGSNSKTALSNIGIVPIFESLRRFCITDNIGVLTGSLIIMPAKLKELIKAISKEIEVEFKELNIAEYVEVVFKGSNKDKVQIITEIFNQGYLNILIGTKSLLGEGWDSPKINSIILASFVGSYILSNQMRGRTIRVDSENFNKTANIWHLATIEPDKDEVVNKKITSNDYETITKRFDCFMAPAYKYPTIESGIERISIIEPPYTREGIQQINQKMLEYANNREEMAKKWINIKLEKGKIKEVVATNESVWPKSLLIESFLFAIVLVIIFSSLLAFIIENTIKMTTIPILLLIAICGYIFVRLIIRTIFFISPRKTIELFGKSLLSTLNELKFLKSKKAKVKITVSNYGKIIYCGLEHASIREKSLFASSMQEMLSMIEKPRYLIVRKKTFDLEYSQSYNCPSIIATNKNSIEIFKRKLNSSFNKYEIIYTKSAVGKKALARAINRSYINLYESDAKRKKII